MTFCRLNSLHASTPRRPPHAVFVFNPTAPDETKPRNTNKEWVQSGNQLKGCAMSDRGRRLGDPSFRRWTDWSSSASGADPSSCFGSTCAYACR